MSNHHWIRDEHGSRCSRCGMYAILDRYNQPWESLHCPHCGEKLLGKAEKEIPDLESYIEQIEEDMKRGKEI